MLHAPATRLGQRSLLLGLAAGALYLASHLPGVSELGLALEPGSLAFGAYIAVLIIVLLSTAVSGVLSAAMAAAAVVRSGERSVFMALPVLLGLVVAVLALGDVFLAR